MNKFIYINIVITLLLTACNTEKLSNEDLQNWQYKDLEKDNIPGISLHKAYDSILVNKTGNPVIIAVIDTEIDLDHEDLKGSFWINTDEIADNGIDDDQNGYIDDIHGWNFLGDSTGNSLLYSNYEYTRIIKKYDSLFNDKTIDAIPTNQQSTFETYLRAKKKYADRMEYALEEKKYINYFVNGSKEAPIVLSKHFPNQNYTKPKIDELIKIHKSNPDTLKALKYIAKVLKYDITEDWIESYNDKTDKRIEVSLNLDYDDRVMIGDDIDDLKDTNYGTNIMDKNAAFLGHGTRMSGILAATRNNNIGIDGISNNFKILSLCISSAGDEQDKDMALAIKYAVDNGARIINISSGKEFSQYPDWIRNAIGYAEKNDVLIITSAGNTNLNLDEETNFSYPNDTNDSGEELFSNFIKVGSSTYSFDKKLKDEDSGYGKLEVDIFAPGEKVYTTATKKEELYRFSNGTSIACAITSGVAGLMRSYYPNLTATQIKDIIMTSGTKVDHKVEVKKEDKTKKLIPFSELSKSGKIVNAYNALLMADKISRTKN